MASAARFSTIAGRSPRGPTGEGSTATVQEKVLAPSRSGVTV